MQVLVVTVIMALFMTVAPAGAQGAGKRIKRAPFPGASEELHLVSGNVQSAGISGMHLVTDSHDVFEFGDR